MMSRTASAGLCLSLLSMTAAGAQPPPAIDACTLLTPAQIERVLGQAVEPGVRRDAGMESNGAYSSACVWTLLAEKGQPQRSAAPLGGRSFVILNAMQWPVGSGRAREFLDSFREAAASGVLPKAPSARKFGDDALWWGDGLAVRSGDVSFGLSVHLPRMPSAVAGAREERLAPLVLDQIDRRNTL